MKKDQAQKGTVYGEGRGTCGDNSWSKGKDDMKIETTGWDNPWEKMIYRLGQSMGKDERQVGTILEETCGASGKQFI